MTWTRRDWLIAAGAVPLELGALAKLAGQGRPGNPSQGTERTGRAGRPDPLPPLGPAPTLPDKASFPKIRGVVLDGAASHPRPAGADKLIRKAAFAETGDP